jgi:hypothetical protein
LPGEVLCSKNGLDIRYNSILFFREIALDFFVGGAACVLGVVLDVVERGGVLVFLVALRTKRVFFQVHLVEIAVLEIRPGF